MNKNSSKSIILGIICFVAMLFLASSTTYAGTKMPCLKQKKETLQCGQKLQLQLKNCKTGMKCQWETQNPKVVRVSKKGVIRAVTPGKTTIICKIKQGKKTYKCTCNVTVKKLKAGPEFLYHKLMLKVGTTKKNPFLVMIKCFCSFEWSTTNPNIAIVSNDGTVTGVSKGETDVICIIKTAFEEFRLKYRVIVTD